MNETPFNPKNPINVIIINGSGGSGKSTFCEMCREISENYIVKQIPLPVVVELSTVDYVKTIAKTTGWDGNKDERGRAYLSALKDAMENYDSLASRKVLETIKASRQFIHNKLSASEEINEYFLKYLFFVNIREPERIDAFHSLCDETGIPCHSMLLTNPNVPPITSNHADASVCDYVYDWYVMNEGTKEDLKETAGVFLMSALNYKSLMP